MEFRYWEQLITWNVNPLKVIIVPFSHNDAGWLQTFEDYYETKTKRILDNIVHVLPDLEEMTFVWSEICFLQYWWDRSSEESRDIFRELVHRGKVEIVTGGWVMPDEATTHIFSLHNQLVEGHQWVMENLGVAPETAWSIDPFGCSSVMAYLLAESGIEGLVIQRIHYSWKKYFSEQGALDMLWEQDFEAPHIKLRVQQNPGYTITDCCGPATGLCSDYDFNLEIRDAEHITFTNVHRKAEIMLGLYGRIGSLSRSNTALITLGGDFRFVNESEWFQQYRNYKALMDYINTEKNYNAEIRFGTVKHFFDKVDKYNVTLQGDFFPYADLDSEYDLAYWTGYFTSRPYWKKLARSLESMLRSTEILFTLTFNAISNISGKNLNPLELLARHFKKLIRARRAAALFQHHDGITGTSKVKVMEDYKSKMLRSLHELKTVQKSCMEMMLNSFKNNTPPDKKPIRKTLVFNNLPYNRSEMIAIKTDYPSIMVIGPNNNEIKSQVNCVYENEQLLKKRSMDSENFELTFIDYLPPFSISVYEIYSIEEEYDKKKYINYEGSNKMGGLCIVNSDQIITFGENGMMNNITKNFGSLFMNTNLNAYTSQRGNSGAYLFKPIRNEITTISEKPIGNGVFIDGDIHKEVTVSYGNGYTVTTRLYGSESNFNQIIDMKITYNMTQENKELFIQFATDLKDTQFYTDVNGLEMRERVRNTQQHVEGNYHPMTTMAYIENTDLIFAILSDHSHGVASVRDGCIEVMLDRRMTTDDYRGLEEAMNDKVKTTSRLYIVLLKSQPNSKQLLNNLVLRLNNPAPIAVTKMETPTLSLVLLNHPLPNHIDILNLRTLSRDDVPTTTALMTVRNMGHTNSSDTFMKESKFDHVSIKNIFKTSLTGLKDGDELDELHDIKVKVFNILSLKIFF
ncbi:alpha-mannosidase 2 [Halyomorpha halys]|uniref:alpha-mannosidase 2 n=1 Tax=Halyomorpha halys TaxID=286706 RepID=UPI0034D36328